MEAFPLILLCSVMVAVTIATGHNNCKTMATFNVGLINSVGQQTSRFPRIIEALKQSRDDFICLQEVWTENDMTAILKSIKSEFPHHWSKIHAAKDYLREPADEHGRRLDTPCSIKDATRLANEIYECGQRIGCFNLTGMEQSFCLALRCSEILKCPTIKESCVSCLFFQTPVPFQEALRECVMPTKYDNRPNQPGLLILSKTRLNRVSYNEYHPGYRTPVERGYIQAELDDGKLVACTHLTSIFPVYVEFDLPYGSYLNQSKDEIIKLGRAFAGKKHIVLGDLNTGPVVTDKPGERNLTGEFPLNYDLLMSFGYRSPYMEQDGRCTYCKDNSLVVDYPNSVIDQVLVSPPNAFSTPLAERAFDTPNPALSDHYGARVQVCDP